MAGIYIHIPYCKKACHYCNFHFSTRLEDMDEMVEAICSEIHLRSLENETTIGTIYFGGGTPSILNPNSIAQVLDAIRTNFNVEEDAEITLEANPDDIDSEKAVRWRTMGINRFSIGIQSFSSTQLQWMNRAHTAEQSLECISIIRDAGFENFSIDLIYGSPTQTLQEWEADLTKALELKIPHLSCYALTVEEKTALYKMIGLGKLPPIQTELQALCFDALMNYASTHGYHHYEISNLAFPGKESRHNSAYWEGVPYLGFGPAAHSYEGKIRSWNISSNKGYVRAIRDGELPSEFELLSDKDMLNEYIMTALRRSIGIQRTAVLDQWGEHSLEKIAREINPFVKQGQVIEMEEGWRLSNSGMFFADGIAATLFTL